MIPFTPPSDSGADPKVFFLASVTGLVRWLDYIPVKSIGAGRIRSYDDDGNIRVTALGSEAGSTRWVDHVPVFEVADGDSNKWRTDNAGFIPVSQAI
jgi:hypothetical protein